MIAVTGSVEVILVPPTASIDESLTDPGAGVVVIAVEQGITHSSYCREAADVHTSYTGASYCTSASTCTAERKIISDSEISCKLPQSCKFTLHLLTHQLLQPSAAGKDCPIE